jgi:hypothetical protein
MNSCQNEINIEMRYYPIVEIKMVLRQPDKLFLEFNRLVGNAMKSFLMS